VTRRANTPVAARVRRLLRECGAALVLVVAVVILIIGQRWRNARREVADAVAEADRLDPGWRFEDMVEVPRPLPPPERNSAVQVLKANSLLARGWPYPPPAPHGEDSPELDMWRDHSPSWYVGEPARQFDALDVRMMRGAMKRAGPALEEAWKLAAMPEGRYPITWAADIDSTLCPWGDALHRVESLLGFDGSLRTQDGDPDGALCDARAILNLGRSIGDEPFFGGPRTRLIMRLQAGRLILRTLAQGSATDAALATTQEAVRGEDAVPLFLLHFRADRAVTHRFLGQVDDGRHCLSEWG
jgi:hypothetical protein